MGATSRGQQLLTMTEDASTSVPLAPEVLGVVDTPGAGLERYRVLERLGEGSMGQVYRARDVELGREVALKWMHPGRFALEHAHARLRREAQSMARVEHPAVVRIYDIGVWCGQLFVAMELARGGTLAAWMAERRRSWREVVRVFVEAGRGLAAAHQVGLVHRDIKPGNILLDAQGRAKVGDFGLARTFDEDDEPRVDAEVDCRLTMTGAIAGTLPYMAPEQLCGELVDARADQFAFCVALWEALCGRRPFAIVGGRRTADEFLRAIVAARIEEPAGVRAPRRLLAVVRRGLTADRERRWRSMDELLDALEGAARPRRVWWLAGAAVIAGLAVVATAAHGARVPAAVSCGRRAQVGAMWNVGERVRYLSGPGNRATLREDASWFDGYARALDGAYEVSCERGDSRRIACLDEALDDLAAATRRADREYWPRLRALDGCGTALREIAGGGLRDDETVRLSTDARQVVVLAAGRPPLVREVGRGGSRALQLDTPLRWLPSGGLTGIDRIGYLRTVDVATGRTNVVAATGAVYDASPGLEHVARLRDDKLWVGIGTSVDPVLEPVTVGTAWLFDSSFSPDGRRFAAVVGFSGGTLYIDDLGRRHREVLALRLHQALGTTTVRWLDAHSVLVSGGATAEVTGDLWRVRVDEAGKLEGPPQILQPGERDTARFVRDVQAGKLLVDRVELVAQNLLIADTAVAPLPSSSRIYPAEFDRAQRRLLAATDAENRWAWASLDGTTVEPIAALDGMHQAAVRPHGVAALDLRGELPVYVELDTHGAETARIEIAAARGVRPELRCAAAACLVRWSAGGFGYTAIIDGQRLAEPVRHELRELGLARVSWALAPDGRRLAIAELGARTLVLYDLAHMTARRADSDTCSGGIRAMKFDADGALVLSCVVTGARAGTEFVLVRREAVRERVVWRGDAFLGSFAMIDHHRTMISTISYPRRFEVLEPR